MNERPILFSGEMVRAILDGRKTQTRRPIRPQPHGDTVTWGCTAGQGFGFRFGGVGKRLNCPYGEPGDKLWGRETWAVDVSYDDLPPRMIPQRGLPAVFYHATAQCKDYKWRPSIHMPRWASRITLEITDIRVERVQNISEAEAQAEGVPPAFSHPGWDGVTSQPSYRWEFWRLWDSLYAARGLGWSVNPWVWVVTFKRVEEVCPKN